MRRIVAQPNRQDLARVIEGTMEPAGRIRCVDQSVLYAQQLIVRPPPNQHFLTPPSLVTHEGSLFDLVTDGKKEAGRNAGRNAYEHSFENYYAWKTVGGPQNAR